ncbi:MAG: chaperone modulator CbpM [Oryzihumus sp.]
MSYALARPLVFDLETFAKLTGLHPEMVRRYVALGLLRASTDVQGRLWLRPDQVQAVARLQRLRAGFALNYAALGLVVDLLDRIAVLEATRIRPQRTGASTWT